MSHNGNGGGAEQAYKCAKCGRPCGNAGAKATHEQACEGAAEPEGEPAENGGYRASDLRFDEIRDAVRRADADTLDATLALHEHEPAEADTRESATAKALIRAKSGGREAYATVFGECERDACEYGANGMHAATCKRHGGADTDAGPRQGEPESGSSGPETTETEESANTRTAPTAPDGRELPSEGAIAGRLMAEGENPETATDMAVFIRDAVREGADVDAATKAAQARFA